MIQVKGLSLSFTKEYYALFNINLNIEKDKTIVLLGDNDSGKTTLIRTMAGLEPFSKGEIFLKNTNIKNVDFSKDVSLAYIAYKPVFFNNKTVYENLNYVLKIRNVDETSASIKINQALKHYNIEALKNIKIKSLSEYQKIVVQLARVSLRQIEIFLVDNIFKNLTESEIKNISEFIKELQKQKATFVIATNNKQLATEYSSNIIKLKFGSIIKGEE